MKSIKLIDGTLSTHFSLGLHADLQNRLYAEVAKVPVAKLLLDAADMTAWKTAIDRENDSARETMASEETARLRKKDEERDGIVSSLFEEIRQAAKSPIAQRAEAGRKLKLVVNTYKGLQRETLAEETRHIEGLLTDLAKQPNAANVNALGLAPLIALLRTANADFATIRNTRALAKAADTLPSGTALRSECDKLMTAIFRHIEAAHMVAAGDPDRKLIADLIDRLNRVIAETKTTYNESMAQKHAAAKGGGSKKSGGATKKPDGATKKPGDPADKSSPASKPDEVGSGPDL